MKNCVAIVLLAVGVGWLSQAQAHTFIYNLKDGTPMFQVQIPDGWRLDLDFDPPLEGADVPPPPRVVEAIPKDGAKLWLGMWVLSEINNIDEAREFFESLEQYVLSDVVIDNSSESGLNGMPARKFSGTARKNKEPVEWVIVLFQVNPQAIAAILYIGVPEARQQRKKELSGIVDSIQPVVD